MYPKKNKFVCVYLQLIMCSRVISDGLRTTVVMGIDSRSATYKARPYHYSISLAPRKKWILKIPLYSRRFFSGLYAFYSYISTTLKWQKPNDKKTPHLSFKNLSVHLLVPAHVKVLVSIDKMVTILFWDYLRLLVISKVTPCHAIYYWVGEK